MKIALKEALWPIFLLPLIALGNPAIALLFGAGLAIFTGASRSRAAAKISRYSLQAAIVLLGFKFGFDQVIEIGANYGILLFLYVPTVILVGVLLGWLINKDHVSSQLITHGTAICGGTAIVSLSPIIRANQEQTAIALTLIFFFNAIALFSFPLIGQILDLSQEQFGIWAALAIHDTSSVVATSSLYGEESLAVATTAKLARTLWILPILLITSISQGFSKKEVSIPWFISLFLLAAASSSLIVFPPFLLEMIFKTSNILIVIALFYIGTSLTRETLKELKWPVAIHATALWGGVVVLTLYGAYNFL